MLKDGDKIILTSSFMDAIGVDEKEWEIVHFYGVDSRGTYEMEIKNDNAEIGGVSHPHEYWGALRIDVDFYNPNPGSVNRELQKLLDRNVSLVKFTGTTVDGKVIAYSLQ